MPSLVEQLREDRMVHGRQWSRPGFQAVALHRLGVWGRQQPLPTRLLVRGLHKVLYTVVRNVYGIEIPLSVHLGRRVKVSHQSGIVINGGVYIGDDCHLRQNVTIGSLGNVVSAERRGSPVLEGGVYVGAGAAIIGSVTIGQGAHIGANATVMTDVPAGATAFARPAQILRTTPRETDTASASDAPATD